MSKFLHASFVVLLVDAHLSVAYGVTQSQLNSSFVFGSGLGSIGRLGGLQSMWGVFVAIAGLWAIMSCYHGTKTGQKDLTDVFMTMVRATVVALITIVVSGAIFS